MFAVSIEYSLCTYDLCFNGPSEVQVSYVDTRPDMELEIRRFILGTWSLQRDEALMDIYRTLPACSVTRFQLAQCAVRGSW